MNDIRILKKLGYIADQKGIINRFLREGTNWNEHLVKTRETIIDFCRKQNNETLVILGSGWLLDVPLEEILKVFREIILVDIFHPPQVRKKMEKFPSVKLVREDITGNGIAMVNEILKKPALLKDKGEIIFKPYIPRYRKASYISVNLLNQLDGLLLSKLVEKIDIDKDILHAARVEIQKAHLQMLVKQCSCLITDVREKISDSEGIETIKDLVFVEIPKGNDRKEWLWTFDTKGEYYPGKKVFFEVVADMYNI